MKKPTEIEGSLIFDEILRKGKEEDKLFVSMSLHIASQIIEILEKKRLKQKDFAALLNKKDAEISKWLSGFHNFTISTICKIESVLGERIILTPKQMREELKSEVNRFISVLNKSIKVSAPLQPIAGLDTPPALSNTKVLQFHPQAFRNVTFEAHTELTGTFS